MTELIRSANSSSSILPIAMLPMLRCVIPGLMFSLRAKTTPVKAETCCSAVRVPNAEARQLTQTEILWFR